MIEHAYDIAILGAGPVGSALALMLARTAPDPTRIALVQDQAPPRLDRPLTTDPRVLALNYGSQILLSQLQAWPEQKADIRCIHVSQRGRLGRTLIRNTDFDVPELGGVVSYEQLQAKLYERVQRSGVTILPGAARVTGQDTTTLTVTQGEVSFTCGVAVQSHGTSDDQIVRREYGQHAVLTRAQAGLPRPGWAWERFTLEGPLALLPHPETADAYAVVWCCTPARATHLAALDERAFSAALNQTFGSRLGRLSSYGRRHVVPLALSARRTLTAGRLVAIGNAAQSLHPVAGQGLNLGLRDAARLAQTLAAWLLTPQTDPTSFLIQFARARRTDRLLTAGITDLMPRIFTTGLAPVEHACGLALLALDLAAPLRAPLAHHLLAGRRA